eukprot:2360575-Pyramimonas_sp.AAC.1
MRTIRMITSIRKEGTHDLYLGIPTIGTTADRFVKCCIVCDCHRHTGTSAACDSTWCFVAHVYNLFDESVHDV